MVQQGKWFREERVPHSHAKPKVPTELVINRSSCSLCLYG